MLRLIFTCEAVLLSSLLHLKKKHNQKTHGSWSPKNPYTSRKSFDKRKAADKKKNFKVGDRVAFRGPKMIGGRIGGEGQKMGKVASIRRDGVINVKTGRMTLSLHKVDLLGARAAKFGTKRKRKKGKKKR